MVAFFVSGFTPVPSGQAAMSDMCKVPSQLLHTPYPLTGVKAKLSRGESVKIVALGSSSTSGTGASSQRATYPSRLQGELQALFPQAKVTVLNRGVPGDTSPTMLERFQRDAVDPKPDLIIWQTGTNSALGHKDIEGFTDDLVRGIRMARTAGIAIMLMGPQFAPRFESVHDRNLYMRHLYTVAQLERVPLFPRYEIMKFWIQSSQFTIKTMVHPDGLHLNDASYACIGALAARMIGGLEFETARAPR